MSDDSPKPKPSPVAAAINGRCPRCGDGRLFSGYLAVAPQCDVCGLDLSFADSADGPAFFIILAVGVLVVIAALVVEILFSPPYWLHFALWVPSILVLSVGLLRPLKALMIGIQYRHNAREGRVAGDGR